MSQGTASVFVASIVVVLWQGWESTQDLVGTVLGLIRDGSGLELGLQFFDELLTYIFDGER
jgi:hypothetical protein